MNLDDAQKKQVTAWIEAGLKLSEIQSRLASDLGVTMTYMEARLLVDDLKLVPKDREPARPAETLSGLAPGAKAPAAAAKPPLQGDAAPPPANRGVSVTVDQLTKPGALVSGNVTFSDGQRAAWYLDEMGRLGLMPTQTGYRPSKADVQEFQTLLEGEMSKLGF